MNPARLQYLLDRGRNLRVAVIGDVMLDQFVWGRVSRISPEAPVPVVEVQKEESYPGGAANVARNLLEFCSNVHIVGRIGQDPFGRELTDLLQRGGIDTSCLITESDWPTIVKTRVIARQQQVVRVDREKKHGLSTLTLGRVVEVLDRLLPSVDALILEDYGKGFITAELLKAVLRIAPGKIITVDPNPNNPLDWSGVTAVKPNRGEAFAVAGVPWEEATDNPLSDPALEAVGKKLLSQWKIPHLLVTLGEHGMVLFHANAGPYHTPTRAREVYDVSGAGDTAIALFTLALAAGATPEEAAEISNHASGVVVGKLGTATLTPEELRQSFDSHAG